MAAPATITVRFWMKVRKGADCWEWIGAKNWDGYGNARWPDGEQRAHRIAYLLELGSIPSGAYVLHTCDNRGCVNPAHLYLGTQKDNMRDRKQRGGDWAHQVRGERNVAAKLTDSTVRDIRARYAKGNGRKLAAQYGVSEGLIYAVVQRRCWRHL